MNATIKALNELFERDLDKLTMELMAYQNEERLWVTDAQIANCGGNLILHLCGNLQHFIGAVLGETGYVRQRDQEFNRKYVSKLDLQNGIDETKRAVLETLEGLNEDVLEKEYPIRVFSDEPMTALFFLIHLESHLNYHLGQINYHRRLLDTNV